MVTTTKTSIQLLVVTFIFATLCIIAFVVVTPAQTEPGELGSTYSVRFTGSTFYPPFQWSQNNEIQGFLVDLERQFELEGHFAVEQNLAVWSDALAAVLTGQADAVALIATEKRAEHFDFSTPFYFVAHALFMRDDVASVGALAAVTDERIAVVKGAYAELELPPALRAQIVWATDELDCLVLVAQRQAELCIEVVQSSRHLIQQYNLDVVQTSPPFWAVPYAFGVRKGNTETLAKINDALSSIIVSGGYQQVYDRWLPTLEWKNLSWYEQLQHYTGLLLVFITLLIGIIAVLVLFRIKTVNFATQLKYTATHDSLTQLLNRDAFVNYLNQQLDNNSADGALRWFVVARIVNLEAVTTAFSHQTSIELVQQFARRLEHPSFHSKAHLGAGLFAFSCHSGLTADQIYEFISTPLEMSNVDIDPVIAMGVVEIDLNERLDNPTEELLRRALTALSYVQSHHMQWLKYHESFEPDPVDLMLLKDFTTARMQDFELLLQPQYSVLEDKINSAEALLRWHHPTRGMLLPATFIPLIEQAGMMPEVTRWVISKACEYAKRLAEDYEISRISVNVTADDLMEPGFVDFVLATVVGLKNVRLCFEITETGLITDSGVAQDVLQTLAKRGICCSVDDFGTGYSSLSYLSLFPIAEVKLDRLFVGALTTDERSRIIISSTIELAHNLGMQVTAEGVEDEETLHDLKALGCDRIQGYFFAKPSSYADVVQYFSCRN